MKFTLPYPPSVNKYWVRTKHGGQMLSDDARSYKAVVRMRALLEKAGRPLEGDVALSVDVYRPRKIGDLDNTLKAIQDSLRGIAYLDDAQVVSIMARRFDDKSNPRAEVTVEVA